MIRMNSIKVMVERIIFKRNGRRSSLLVVVALRRLYRCYRVFVGRAVGWSGR